jgi:hypothetical protein
MAHSAALLADSVDMLGDAIVYGFSLSVIHRGPVWKAKMPHCSKASSWPPSGWVCHPGGREDHSRAHADR